MKLFREFFFVSMEPVYVGSYRDIRERLAGNTKKCETFDSPAVSTAFPML